MSRWSALFSDLDTAKNAKIDKNAEAQVFPGFQPAPASNALNAENAKSPERPGSGGISGNFGISGNGGAEVLKPASDKASALFGNSGILALDESAKGAAAPDPLRAVADLLRAVADHEYGRRPGQPPGAWWTDGTGTLFCRDQDGDVQRYGPARVEALLALPLPPGGRAVLMADLAFGRVSPAAPSPVSGIGLIGPQPGTCPTCASRRWWRRAADAGDTPRTCTTCHPPIHLPHDAIHQVTT